MLAQAKTQRVRVIYGFILGPGEYATPGQEVDLPLQWAIRERAAGSVAWIGPEAVEDDPGITKEPVIETREPQPLNRDPKVRSK